MNLQEIIIKWLYYTMFGRKILSVMVRPSVSKAVGRILDLPVSAFLVPGFIKKHKIDMSQYEERLYISYNDFFTRKVKPEERPVCHDPDALIAPCDARLTVHPIKEDASFMIKGTAYTMKSLLKNKKLAERYTGGTLLLFRLTVDDYHRYCYIDNGIKTKNYHIPGIFHTVNPMANDCCPIYKENTREYSLLKSERFGTVLMMEVGAMMVGRIVNYDQQKEVVCGQEKGRFEFGGSTIILCFQKNRIRMDRTILARSENGIETQVKMGSRIGEKIKKNENKVNS